MIIIEPPRNASVEELYLWCKELADKLNLIQSEIIQQEIRKEEDNGN